jgi:hypothetical protein
MRAKMGNGLPKMGSSLPISAVDSVTASYELAISTALRSELGGSHQAIKTLMRWTGVSERTAKSWLAGSAGPSGAHLIALMSASELVFEVVLRLAGRNWPPTANSVPDATNLLRQAIALLEGGREI